MFKLIKDKEFIKKFFNISLPVMCSALVTFLVSLIDNLMVSTVSNEAVSGVYAANQITYIFMMGGFGILEGVGIFVQQYNGVNDKDHIKACFRYKWKIMLYFMLIAIPLLWLLKEPLILIQCSKDTSCELILNEGIDYFNIVFISYIPFGIGFIYYYTFQETGNTKFPMISSICALISNIIFNSLFIFVFNMGVKGAAIATVISRVIECIVICLLARLNNFEFCLKNSKGFKVSKELNKAVFKKGLFLFVNEMGFAIGVLLQGFAFSQRDSVLSSISIVNTVAQLFYIFGNGFNVSVGVIIGSYLGRNEFDKAKESFKKLITFGIFITILIGILLISLSPYIPLLYKEVSLSQKELASYLIVVLSCVLPFQIFAMGSYFTLRAGGRTLETMVFDTGSMLVLYVPVSWILASLTNIPMIYIYLIVRSIDIIKAIVGVFFIKKEKWVKNITINNDFINV